MEEPNINEGKDKNGTEKKSSSGLFQFYAMIVGWVGFSIYNLYAVGFDSQLTMPFIAIGFLGLGYLILANKKGWFRGGKKGKRGKRSGIGSRGTNY